MILLSGQIKKKTLAKVAREVTIYDSCCEHKNEKSRRTHAGSTHILKGETRRSSEVNSELVQPEVPQVPEELRSLLRADLSRSSRPRF